MTIITELTLFVLASTNNDVAVTLVLKLALGLVNDPVIIVAVNDLINVAFGPRDPEIPADVNPTAPPSSKNDTLVLNEADGATNDPEMPVFNA